MKQTDTHPILPTRGLILNVLRRSLVTSKYVYAYGRMAHHFAYKSGFEEGKKIQFLESFGFAQR